MIKKPILLTAAVLLLTACGTAEQEKSPADTVSAETSSPSETQKDDLQEEDIAHEVPEETAEEPLLDLNPLAEKIWSNPDQNYFIYFTKLTDEQVEFRLLDATLPEASEQIFTAELTEHDATQWSGTLLPVARSLYTTETNEFDLKLTDNDYQISLGDLDAFTLQESTLTLDEWEDKKESLQELSDLEAVELIQRIESESAERFAASFTETMEGYAYTDNFESIVSQISHLYTDNYLADTLKPIYDNPIYLLETLYAFPLADTLVTDSVVYRSPGQLTVYTESEFYGYPAYTRFTLTAEDKEWKLSSRDTIMDSEMAKYAVLTVSGEGEDPDAYAELINTPNFHQLVEIIQTGERYYISTHLDYDDIQVDVWLYQVDPLTGMVYSYDRVRDLAEEIGTLPDSE